MHRKAAPVLVLFVFLVGNAAAGMVGCGNATGADVNGGAKGDGAPAHQIVFATGEISGAYYRVGAVLASLWSKEVRDTEVVTRPTGGAMANLKMLSNAEADIGLSASNTALRAYNGTPPFQVPASELRAIAALYPEVFHFVARRNSGLRLVSDIRGLRVAVGGRLGGTHLTTRELLEAHGLSADSIRVEYLSFSEAVFAMEAGMVDVAVIGAGVPPPAVQDAAAMTDIRLLSVDPGK
ncbi:MAG: TAXI family TRAP transporter solute-binding subunit, partial [Bacillota bacterium]